MFYQNQQKNALTSVLNLIINRIYLNQFCYNFVDERLDFLTYLNDHVRWSLVNFFPGFELGQQSDKAIRRICLMLAEFTVLFGRCASSMLKRPNLDSAILMFYLFKWENAVWLKHNIFGTNRAMFFCCLFIVGKCNNFFFSIYVSVAIIVWDCGTFWSMYLYFLPLKYSFNISF